MTGTLLDGWRRNVYVQDIRQAGGFAMYGAQTPDPRKQEQSFTVRHNPWDVAVIAVLAGGWFYFAFTQFSELNLGIPVFLTMTGLVFVVSWLLGSFSQREAEIEDLRLEVQKIAADSEARDRYDSDKLRR